MLIAVITTIQKPTPSVVLLSERIDSIGGELIVAGDKKGPGAYPLPTARFLSLSDQLESGFRLATALPTGHYARKNVGYLEAMRQGTECIYESDDDNAPKDSWTPRNRTTEARECPARLWANVYRMFSEEHIWPRGFPLDRITDPATFELEDQNSLEMFDAPIQQGLADGSPDVDAVWRLTLDRSFRFDDRPSVHLPPGTWCPFNSQTTWWWKPVFPLLYLPSYCSFRMTDIWRSFVAQRCVWELGCGLVFHAAEVQQERNQHNLLRDFEDEISGYLNNDRIVSALDALTLRGGEQAVSDNLMRCYEAMVRLGVIPEKELGLVEAWVEDIAVLEAEAEGAAA